jgi:hypothetical protein
MAKQLEAREQCPECSQVFIATVPVPEQTDVDKLAGALKISATGLLAIDDPLRTDVGEQIAKHRAADHPVQPVALGLGAVAAPPARRM